MVLAGCVLWLAACAPATVNKQSVRATDQAPESTQVAVVQIPYDPNRPYYVVTVEPFGIAVSDRTDALLITHQFSGVV
jgi:murein tripeptide amidase MpaA